MMMRFSTISLGLPDGSQIPPNRQVPEGVFSEDQLKRLIAKGYVIEASSEPTVETPKGSVSEVKTVGNWDLDPASLVSDSLDVLNVKATEHALLRGLEPPEPFTDEEEAVAFMSADFVSE